MKGRSPVLFDTILVAAQWLQPRVHRLRLPARCLQEDKNVHTVVRGDQAARAQGMHNAESALLSA